jgi:hypothetical protein
MLSLLPNSAIGDHPKHMGRNKPRTQKNNLLCYRMFVFQLSLSLMWAVYQSSEFTVTEMFSLTCVLAKTPSTPFAKQNISDKVINKVTLQWLGTDDYHISTHGSPGNAIVWYTLNNFRVRNFMVINRK